MCRALDLKIDTDPLDTGGDTLVPPIDAGSGSDSDDATAGDDLDQFNEDLFEQLRREGWTADDLLDDSDGSHSDNMGMRLRQLHVLVSDINLLYLIALRHEEAPDFREHDPAGWDMLASTLGSTPPPEFVVETCLPALCKKHIITVIAAITALQHEFNPRLLHMLRSFWSLRLFALELLQEHTV